MDLEPRQSLIRHFGAYIVRWPLLLAYLQTVALLVVAFTAVFAISEIAARDSVLSMFTSQSSSLKAKFVEQNRDSSSYADRVSSTSTETANNTADTQKRLLIDIRVIDELKIRLQTLIAIGSEQSNLSLRGIVHELDNTGVKNNSVQPKETVAIDSLSTFILHSSASLRLLSSDQLLAIAIMASGAIGAMITALRGNGVMTLRALSLGLASGFVVYLAIKGGKHVFLLQAQGESVSFNPYGSAFAGLLVGLFTDRAHQILLIIVEDFVERLRAASGGKKEPD